ncbi:MAG TPA: acyltransferase [Verrucomicrobiae bacterium]|nr:acyltransferase [Verrucomicrobiae bacterium]
MTQNAVKIRSWSSIEVLRTLACFGVVCLHTRPFLDGPFRDSPWYAAGVALHAWGRFAVPVFFMISGFFFGNACRENAGEEGRLLRRFALKVGRYFLLWCAVYAVFPDRWAEITLERGFKNGLIKTLSWHLADAPGEIAGHFWAFLMSGTQLHLWFLPALLVSVAIIVFFVKMRRIGLLLPLSAAGFVLAAWWGRYEFLVAHGQTFLPQPNYLLSRLGFLCGLVYVVWGWRYGFKKEVPRRGLSIACVLVGIAAMAIEEAAFASRDYQLISDNIMPGVALFSIGVFGLALHFPKAGQGTPLERWGIYTLGIYLGHIVVREAVALSKPAIAGLSPWGWEIFFPFGVFFVSLGLAILLRKMPFLRAWV